MQRDLARSRTIKHPSGVTVQTPLLVPGFSSKGFRFRGNKSEAAYWLKEVASQVLEESFLVSAYDIKHKFMYQPGRFPCRVRLVFVDSGGYETSDDHDLPSIRKDNWRIKEWAKWDVAKLEGVLKRWPKRVPAVFISYDRSDKKVGLKKQIERAHKMFTKFPEHLHEFLVKPERGKKYIDTGHICANIEKFGDFSIIGLTEKELGKSLMERMVSVAKIRLALDQTGNEAPIHVFGSLDTITSCLYFLAGVEIFDGLTWLRYGYWQDQAVYYQNYAFLKKMSLSESDENVIAYMLLDNLRYLVKLRDKMTGYLLTGSFNKFGKSIKELIHEAYDMLRTKLGGQI